MISGRRLSHHIAGVVTFWPSFMVSGSGTFGIGIGLRLVVVGVVWSFFVAARSRTQGLDPELIHHVLVVLIRREGRWRRQLRTALVPCSS